MSRIAPVFLAATLGLTASVAAAQAPLPYPQGPPPTAQAPLPGPAALPPEQPPILPAAELDRIVSPIALYPDPLLAQVLAAATFSPDIPGAAQYADQHRFMTGPTLTAAITADQVPWYPSVQALLPFPSILDMMASAMPWTEELGNAFLAQPQDVMMAVQRMRQLAASYGYLRSSAQVVVTTGPFIEIRPVNPAFIAVPIYNPAVVFMAPRPGFAVVGGINFGFGVTLGPAFVPWGWGGTRVVWSGRPAIFINNAAWGRTWANRATYVHPFAVERHPPSPRFVVNELAARHAQERVALDSRQGDERAQLAARHEQELQGAHNAEEQRQLQARHQQEQQAMEQRHQQERATVQQRQEQERKR